MPKYEMPNLDNYTAEGIVDVCAPDQEELNRLTTITKYLKTGLKARLEDKHLVSSPETLPQYSVEGESYTASITAEVSRAFSMEKLQQVLTPQMIEACYIEVQKTVIRFTKRPQPQPQPQPQPSPVAKAV